MKVKQLLKQSEEELALLGLDQNVPKVLFYHIANTEPHALYLMMEEEAKDDLVASFQVALDSYKAGKPVQYIKGVETFFGRDFIVNDAVLIPRYETEELVEQILYRIDDYFHEYNSVSLCDVGTGSGAIAITLALEEPKLQVLATDISPEALLIANQNAKKLGADVTFTVGDMLAPIIESKQKIDVFVSNPPYIPQNQNIQKVVKDNEPHVALFGGDDGLYFYIQIFSTLPLILKDRAMAAFEIGFDQKEAIEQLVQQYFPTNSYEIKKDMSGKDRMLFIYINIGK